MRGNGISDLRRGPVAKLLPINARGVVLDGREQERERHCRCLLTTRIAPAVIEQRTIAQVPAGGRHGRVRDLFTIWFGSNVMLLTIVTGALARRSTA